MEIQPDVQEIIVSPQYAPRSLSAVNNLLILVTTALTNSVAECVAVVLLIPCFCKLHHLGQDI